MQRMVRVRTISLIIMLIGILSGSVLSAQQANRPQPANELAAVGIERLTDRWLIQVTPGSDPAAIASRFGYEFIGETGLPNTYEIRIAGSARASLETTRTRRADLQAQPDIVLAEQVVVLQRETRSSIPTDPYYPTQWHLNNTGQSGGTAGEDVNITGAWVRPNWPNGGFTGNGVQIGVLDDGVESAHPDLGNYSTVRSYDYLDTDTNATPNSGDAHGTAAAGVAAADDDSKCGTGSAYDATLSSQRLIAGAFTSTQEANALGNTLATTTDLDISSNSWGPSDSGAVVGEPSPTTYNIMQGRVMNWRGGLGWVYVWANGNGHSSNFQNADWAGADAYTSSRYTVAVSATDHNGNQSSYSEGGSNIIINAPSSGAGVGITTTDRLGSGEGYGGLADPDCTDSYGGTSSATPLVSGIIALMLEANPNLTWRDVQYVLLNTTEQNDPTHFSWVTNGAGYKNSEYYGFGRVDAERAVTTAALWNNIPAEISESSGVQTVNLNPPDGGSALTTTYTFNSSNINSLEHVEVTVNASATYRGDLELILTSPDGTSSMLMKRRFPDGSPVGWNDWIFTSSRFWGEDPQGTWTLSVADPITGGSLTFNDYNITLHGLTTAPEYVDIALSQSDSPDPVTVGDAYEHTVTVTNVSSSLVDNASVEIDLPAGFYYNTATVSDSGSCSGTGTVVCSWSTAKAPSTAYTATLNLSVDITQSPGTYTLTSTARVGTQNDLNTLNNAYLTETIDVQAFQGDTDTNNDGITSPTDVMYVINRLGTSDPDADVDNNGFVNSTDVQYVLDNLGN